MDFTVILAVSGCLIGVLAAPTPDVTSPATEDPRLVHDDVRAQRHQPQNDAVAMETGSSGSGVVRTGAVIDPEHPVDQLNNAPKTVLGEPVTNEVVSKKPAGLENPTAVTRIPFKDIVAAIERAREEQGVEPVAKEEVLAKPVGPDADEHIPTKQVGQERLSTDAVPVEEVLQPVAANSVPDDPFNVDKVAARPAAQVAAEPEEKNIAAEEVVQEIVPADQPKSVPTRPVNVSNEAPNTKLQNAEAEPVAEETLVDHAEPDTEEIVDVPNVAMENVPARPVTAVKSAVQEATEQNLPVSEEVVSERVTSENVPAAPAAHGNAVEEPEERNNAANQVVQKPVNGPIEASSTLKEETAPVQPKPVTVPRDSNAVQRVQTDTVESAPTKPQNADDEPAATPGTAVPAISDARERVDAENAPAVPDEENIAPERVVQENAPANVANSVPARPVNVPIKASPTVKKERVPVKPKPETVPGDSNAEQTNAPENAPAKPRNSVAKLGAKEAKAVPDRSDQERIDAKNVAADTAPARPVVAERTRNRPKSKSKSNSTAESNRVAPKPAVEEMIPVEPVRAKPVTTETISKKPVTPAVPAAVQRIPAETAETESIPSRPAVLEVALHARPKTQETVADKPIAAESTVAKTGTQESAAAEQVDNVNAGRNRAATKTEQVAATPITHERGPADQTATENVTKPVAAVPGGTELEEIVAAKSPTQQIIASVEEESPTKPVADESVQTKPVVEPANVDEGAAAPLASVAAKSRPTTAAITSKVARPVATKQHTKETTAAVPKLASSLSVSEDESSQETVEVPVKPKPIQTHKAKAQSSTAAVGNTVSANNVVGKDEDETETKVNPASPRADAPEGTRHVTTGLKVAANDRERIDEEVAERHDALTSRVSHEKLSPRTRDQINGLPQEEVAERVHQVSMGGDKHVEKAAERAQEETTAVGVNANEPDESTNTQETPTRPQHTSEPKSPESLRNAEPEPEETRPQTPQADEKSKPEPEHSDKVAEIPVPEPAVETASSAKAAVPKPENTDDASEISQPEPIRENTVHTSTSAPKPKSNAREVAPSKTDTEQAHNSIQKVSFPTETQPDTETFDQTDSKSKDAEENVREIVHDMPTFARQISQKPEPEAAESLTEREPETEHQFPSSVSEERRPYINDAIDHYPKDVVHSPEAVYPKAQVIEETVENHESPVAEPEQKVQSALKSKPGDEDSHSWTEPNEGTEESKPPVFEHNVYPPSQIDETVPAEFTNSQQNAPPENTEPSVQNNDVRVGQTNSESIPEHEWSEEPEIESAEDPYHENNEQTNQATDWKTPETEASETHNDVPGIQEVPIMENGEPIYIEPTEVPNVQPHDHNSFDASLERSEPKPNGENIETDSHVPDETRFSQIEDEVPKYVEPTSKPVLEATTMSTWSNKILNHLSSLLGFADFISEPDATTVAPMVEEIQHIEGLPSTVSSERGEVHDDTILIGVATVAATSEEGKSLIEHGVHVIHPMGAHNHHAEVTTEVPYAKPEVIPIEDVWNPPLEAFSKSDNAANSETPQSTDSSIENFPNFNVVGTEAPSLVVQEGKKEPEVDTKYPMTQDEHENDEHTDIPSIVVVRTDAPPMLPIQNADVEVTSFPEHSDWEQEHAEAEVPEVIDITTQAAPKSEVVSADEEMGQTLETPIVHVNAPETEEEHPLENEKHPLENEEHPLVNEDHPSVNEEHPLVNEEHPLVNEEHPSVIEEHPSVNAEHPAEHPSVNEEGHSVNEEHPVVKEDPYIKPTEETPPDSNEWEDRHLSVHEFSEIAVDTEEPIVEDIVPTESNVPEWEPEVADEIVSADEEMGRATETPNVHVIAPETDEEHSLVNEEHPSENEEHLLENEEHPSVNEEHRSINEEHPLVNEDHHSANEKHPSEHPSVNEEHHLVNEEHHSVNEEHHLVNEEHPLVNEDHPSVNEEHPSVNEEHPSVNEEHLSVNKENPSVGEEHPSVNAEHPAEGPSVNEEHPVVKEDPYIKPTEETSPDSHVWEDRHLSVHESSEISVDTEEPLVEELVPTESNVPEWEPEVTDEILHMEPRTETQENLPGTVPVTTEYPLIQDANIFPEAPVKHKNAPEQGKEPNFFGEDESSTKNWQGTIPNTSIETITPPTVEDDNSTATSIDSEISTSGTIVTERPTTTKTPDGYFPEEPKSTEQNGTVLPTSVGSPKDDKVTELSSQHGPSTFTIVSITVPVLLLMVGIMACGWEYRRNRAHRTSTQSLLNRVEVVPKEQMNSMADFTNPNFEQQLSDEEETVYAKALEIHDDKPVEV